MKVNFYRFHPLPIGLSIAGDVFETLYWWHRLLGLPHLY